MIKKTVKYTNPFTEEEETKDLYFHLSKGKLAEMQLSMDGGLMEHLQRVVEAGSSAGIVEAMKLILGKSYGIRTSDDKFLQSDEITSDFLNSEVYAEFMWELLQNPSKVQEFIHGILPKDMRDKLPKSGETVELSADSTPVQEREPGSYTHEELVGLSADEFKALMNKFKGGNVPPTFLKAAMARF